MNEGRDLTGEEENDSPLSCTVKSPHATWSEFRIGDLSILFSYGRPVGFKTPERTLVRDKVKRATVKHLNAWQDFRIHTSVKPKYFNEELVIEIQEALYKIQAHSNLGPRNG